MTHFEGPIVQTGFTESSGAGISLEPKTGIHKAEVSGAGDDVTLKDGEEGQEIIVLLSSKTFIAATLILSADNMSGFSQVVMTTVGETAHLIFLDGSWSVIASTGTIS